MMRSQIQDVEAKLSELIGKSAKGADFSQYFGVMKTRSTVGELRRP